MNTLGFDAFVGAKIHDVAGHLKKRKALVKTMDYMLLEMRHLAVEKEVRESWASAGIKLATDLQLSLHKLLKLRDGDKYSSENFQEWYKSETLEYKNGLLSAIREHIKTGQEILSGLK